jgi:hypothetical protein
MLQYVHGDDNMKYENAEKILPAHLLKQIQEYASGKLLYIPSKDTKRGWGETSGYKQYLHERNHDIKLRFSSGAGIDQLADEYYLSCDSIKRIVYKKEELFLEYKCSLSSAQEYARVGRIEDWIHAYLLSDGHNKDFSDGLKLYERYFIGPMKMPLSLFYRCCGPESNMKYRVNAEWFEKHVQDLVGVISSEKDLPPLIVNYVDDRFELNDGNHRFEAYSRLGIKDYSVIVWITEKPEYDMFLSKYAEYLPA